MKMKDSLVVCYSYTGNTYSVAQEISRQTGGPLCELYPKQPYPMIFTKLLEQARKEIESEFCLRLFPLEKNIEEYDMIYVGTPNWCGTIAPPVSSWLKQNNLAGKVVVPFYTHCGGGHGNIEADVSALCPQSVVAKGISVVNDGGGGLSEKIATWLNEIKRM